MMDKYDTKMLLYDYNWLIGLVYLYLGLSDGMNSQNLYLTRRARLNTQDWYQLLSRRYYLEHVLM